MDAAGATTDPIPSGQRPAPIPSIEWEITTRCNYHCSYCSQSSYANLLWGDSSDATVEAVFRLLEKLPAPWLVKVAGGEPFVHKRFLEICRNIVALGHRVCTTTNLSAPDRMLEEFIAATGPSLEFVTASLHLEEIRIPELFLQKARLFNAKKHQTTRLTVTTVGVESKLDDLRKVADQCSAAGIPFEVAPLKEGGAYVEYQDEAFKQFLKEWPLFQVERLRGMKLRGTLCHTGHKFIRINVEGDVLRCYNMQPRFHLGNITQGTFRWFDEPKPCLASRCTCTVPANRNMIEFGNRVPALDSAADFASALIDHAPAIARLGSKWAGKGIRHLAGSLTSRRPTASTRERS